MRLIFLLIFPLFVFAGAAARFEDGEHFSPSFGQHRKYRIFLPAHYDPQGTDRFPVVYYCHSMGGRYAWDPYDRDSLSRLYPYGGDFLKFLANHNLIIVNMDGYLGDPAPRTRDGIGFGTAPYYGFGPDSSRYMPRLLKAGGFRFSTYIRELVGHIDSSYRTLADPRYRGITGLSMGGHAAIFIGANNPGLFQSISSFCHSCAFHPVGLPPYRTRAMAFDLWRNFEGCQVRTSQNTMDYLSFYDQELSRYLRLGGFPYEYHVAQFNRHWAADADSQLIFHLRSFETEKRRPDHFSHVNLYPDFDVWGWEFKTEKKEPGWTVIENAAVAGFNVHTTLHFRFPAPLSGYRISFTTPPFYTPSQTLTVTDFDIQEGRFTARPVRAGKDGRLTGEVSGGLGHAVGILDRQRPLVTLWPFKNNTTLFLQAGRDTSLPITLINKGTLVSGKVAVEARALSPWIIFRDSTVAVPPLKAGERRIIPGAFRLSVRVADTIPIGGLRFRVKVNGRYNGEAMTVPVQAMENVIPDVKPSDVLIFDGQEMTLNLFRPFRYNGEGLMMPEKIRAGRGNGNGKPEPGESIVIFVRDSVGLSPKDTNAYHPVYFVNGPVPGVAQKDLFEVEYTRAQKALGSEIGVLPDFKAGVRLLTVRKVFKTRIVKGSDKNVDEDRYRYGMVVLQ